MAERMRLRAALSRAVTEGAFALEYQPIVALDSGATVGFEALVRWQHPDVAWSGRPSSSSWPRRRA